MSHLVRQTPKTGVCGQNAFEQKNFASAHFLFKKLAAPRARPRAQANKLACLQDFLLALRLAKNAGVAPRPRREKFLKGGKMDKDVRMTIRFSEQEARAVDATCKALGLTRSAYIRLLAKLPCYVNELPKNTRQEDINHDYIFVTLDNMTSVRLELSRQGNNINQIARWLNTVDPVNNDHVELGAACRRTKYELSKIVSFHDEIGELVRDMDNKAIVLV